MKWRMQCGDYGGGRRRGGWARRGCRGGPGRPPGSQAPRSDGGLRVLAAPRLAESEELAELPAAEVAETTPSLSWSLRSRRHRLSARPTKRLFTPDIKRLLKGWLVRRRDNPYPSRAEKEALSTRTGLTYMQVCNWFANWRRKLRDCGRARPPGDGAGEDDDQGDDGAESWAHLIRQYHALAEDPDTATAQENFSISSSDSIWEERRTCSPGSSSHGLGMSKCSSHPNQNACVSSTTTETAKFSSGRSGTTTPSPTRDVGRCSPRPDVSEDLGDVPAVSAAQPSASTDDLCGSDLPAGSGSTLLLSKWLESAARYQPCGPGGPKPCQRASQRPSGCWGASAAVEHTLAGRHREELDAAEALAFLSSLRFR